MISLSRALRISRPRFWIYFLGPYLLGATAPHRPHTLLAIVFLTVFGIVFTFPANLFVYGVNDICDYDTDRYNIKKQTYEALVLPEERRSLIIWITALCAPFLLLFLVHAEYQARAYMAAYILLSIFYSAPPIRAKGKPFFDSLFNILYAMPGFIGWSLAGGGDIPLRIVAASFAWTAAMHAFSAVPDTEADQRAGVATSATKMGSRNTILVCLVLFSSAAILTIPYFMLLSVFIGLSYIAMMFWALRNNPLGRVSEVYRFFPALNGLCGFLLFVAINLSELQKM